MDVTRRHVIVACAAAVQLIGCLLRWPALGLTEWNGFQFASNIAAVGSQLNSSVFTWAGTVWFAVPLAAGVALMASMAADRWARRVWRVCGLLGVVVCVPIAWATIAGGLATGGAVGPIVGAVGAATIAVVSFRRPSAGSDGL